MRLKLISLYFIFPILLSCSSRQEKVKVLVIGDVQLKGSMKSYTKDEWSNQSMDTFKFAKLFKEVLDREKPDYIFQTGDWVNYNDSFSLQILDTLGNGLERLPLPYSEWDFMNRQIPKSLKNYFFMAYGNHESYSAVILKGIYHPDFDILGNISSSIDLSDSKKGKESLIDKFPHLSKAEFNSSTATYYLNNQHFSLLSIDGLDNDREGLLKFIEEKLEDHQADHNQKSLFVISHYPIFTGLDSDQDSDLVFNDIRVELIYLFDKYNVDYVFNGHEHFYLRYSDTELRKHFLDPYPERTKYITISDFANPYSRDLKRVTLDSLIDEMNYFKGTHYLTIEIDGNEHVCQTYAFQESDSTWKKIDEFYSSN